MRPTGGDSVAGCLNPMVWGSAVAVPGRVER